MTAKPPTVTVVMSCYNSAQWLGEAIESVLSQTFADFEFVVIDDGSTDDTLATIERYAARDERIVPVSKPNTGLTDSLNVGLGLARGAWVARLDADDVCSIDRLREQVSFVQVNHGLVLVGTGCREIDAAGGVVKEHSYPASHDELRLRLEQPFGFFPHSSAFYNTYAVRALGGYNLLFRKSQDWDLWLRLAEVGKIACLQRPLVMIRKHSGQISSSGTGVSQVIYWLAACTCHHLRLLGHPDPSIETNSHVSQRFMEWIEQQAREEGLARRFETWVSVRAAMRAERNPLRATVKALRHGSQAKDIARFVFERAMGVRLPRRLAQTWIRDRCAAS